jgi:hypothetical protein
MTSGAPPCFNVRQAREKGSQIPQLPVECRNGAEQAFGTIFRQLTIEYFGS